MTIDQALIWANKKLKSKSKTSCLDAEVLLSFVLKKQKEYIYTYPEKKLTKLQENKFKNLINSRIKGKPVAYLTKNKEFYGFNFYIDNRVLVPRPETEILVDEIISIAKPKMTIADIGTGSGCIAIALAKHLPKNKITATDISKNALKIAKKNANRNSVKIDFFAGDLLSPIKNKKIDIIAANLPYGSKKIWKGRESIKFEPAIALYAKNYGIEIYENFFHQLTKLKYKPKYIVIEIDSSQPAKLKKIITKIFPKAKIIIKKDLAGLNRILIIKF